MKKIRAYYLEKDGKKRNTPVYATSAAEAKRKAKRPSGAGVTVYAVRDRTPPKNGQWDRRGPSGKLKEHGRGYGPKTTRKR